MDNESYIGHIVIALKNHEKSKNFYEKVFGWKSKNSRINFFGYVTSLGKRE